MSAARDIGLCRKVSMGLYGKIFKKPAVTFPPTAPDCRTLGFCRTRCLRAKLSIRQLGDDGNLSKPVLLPREKVFSGTNRRLAAFFFGMVNRMGNSQSSGFPHNFYLKKKSPPSQNALYRRVSTSATTCDEN